MKAKKSPIVPHSLILIITLLLLSHSTYSVFFRCNFNSDDEKPKEELSVGDSIVICLHFVPHNVKVAFNVKVNTPSLYRLDGALPYFIDENSDMILQFGNSNALSENFVN